MTLAPHKIDDPSETIDNNVDISPNLMPAQISWINGHVCRNEFSARLM